MSNKKCGRTAEPIQKSRQSCSMLLPCLTHAWGGSYTSTAELRHLILSPFRSSLYVPPCCNGGCVREDAAGVRASGFRLWSSPRLAGESAAEALPGLEEAEAARQAGDNSEEAGPGLSARGVPSPPGPHSPSPTRPGSACRRWIKSTGKKAFLLALYESIFKIKRLNNLESFPSSQRK